MTRALGRLGATQPVFFIFEVIEMSNSNKGFGSMDPERQRQVASMGGRSVPDEKRSFSQNRELAVRAGRKGGMSISPEKRSFSQNRELARASGRKGGLAVPGDKRSFSRDSELAVRAGSLGGLASHRRDP